MIFYFSGTGNSKWIAEKIGETTGDKVISIIGLEMTEELEKEIINEEQIGIVFPIYAWGVAEPVKDFVKILPRTKGFTFGIATCGKDTGKALKKLSGIYPLDSGYSIEMPSNYIIGADLESDDVIKAKLEKANEAVEKIAKKIKVKEKIYMVNEGGGAAVKSSIVNWGFNKFARSTKPFVVSDKCISCGLCQFVCPAKTIEIYKKKPQWGEKCYQCMACISRCPQRAIEYGSKTLGKKTYYIDDWN